MALVIVKVHNGLAHIEGYPICNVPSSRTEPKFVQIYSAYWLWTFPCKRSAFLACLTYELVSVQARTHQLICHRLNAYTVLAVTAVNLLQQACVQPGVRGKALSSIGARLYKLTGFFVANATPSSSPATAGVGGHIIALPNQCGDQKLQGAARSCQELLEAAKS